MKGEENDATETMIFFKIIYRHDHKIRTSGFDATKTFPKLKSICVNDEPIRHFFRLNQQLKEIDIDLCNLSNEVMQSISEYTPQIEKLALKSYSPDFIECTKYLKQLTALISLQICFGGESQNSLLRMFIWNVCD